MCIDYQRVFDNTLHITLYPDEIVPSNPPSASAFRSDGEAQCTLCVGGSIWCPIVTGVSWRIIYWDCQKCCDKKLLTVPSRRVFLPKQRNAETRGPAPELESCNLTTTNFEPQQNATSRISSKAIFGSRNDERYHVTMSKIVSTSVKERIKE